MPFIDFNTRKKKKVLPGIKGPVYHSTSLTLGQFTLEKGAEIPRHYHPQEQLTYLIEGQMEFIINNEIKLLKPGMAAFVPPNAPHSAKAITKCKILDCFHPVYEGHMDKETESK